MASITWASVKDLSGTVQKQPTTTWPSGYENKLPVVPDNMGSFVYGKDEKPLAIDDYLDSILPPFFLFACHVWYQYQGRNLTREESRSIMRLIFGEEKARRLVYTFDRFNDPENPMTKAFNGVGGAVKAEWKLEVEFWFRQLQEDPKTKDAAKARIKALDGFTGRVPHLTMKKNEYWPKVNEVKLEPYQIYIHHGVLNWCTDRNGNRFSEFTGKPIFAHYYNYTPSGSFPPNEKLLEEESQFFKNVDSVIGHEPFKSQFKKIAEKIINDYEVNVLKLQPRLGMETASQIDPLPTATTEMGALTLTATAGSSRQPTTRDAEEEIFKEYLMSDASYEESESDETQSDPSESDIKGKGKGKGPDRGENPDKSKDNGKARAR